MTNISLPNFLMISCLYFIIIIEGLSHCVWADSLKKFLLTFFFSVFAFSCSFGKCCYFSFAHRTVFYKHLVSGEQFHERSI